MHALYWKAFAVLAVVEVFKPYSLERSSRAAWIYERRQHRINADILDSKGHGAAGGDRLLSIPGHKMSKV